MKNYPANMLTKAADFTKNWEGLRLHSYQDSGAVWTIGYGTTHNVTPDMTITEEEALNFLARDLSIALTKLSKLTKVPLTEKQTIALIDFVYNVGCGAYQRSTLRMKLNRGEYEAASKEFLKWNKVRGKPIRGLSIRRIAESNLFSFV